jgi:uncharacterized membrane protein YccC
MENSSPEAGLHRTGLAASLQIAVQFVLISFLSYWLADGASMVFDTGSGYIGALWAVISGIIVIQESRKSTIDTAWLRILGSLAGAVISAAYLSFLPFTPLAMALLIGLTILICHTLGVPGYARLAALTVAVVMVFSVVNPDIPPVVNAATRFFEVIIGSSVAVAIVWIWPRISPAGVQGA